MRFTQLRRLRVYGGASPSDYYLTSLNGGGCGGGERWEASGSLYFIQDIQDISQLAIARNSRGAHLGAGSSADLEVSRRCAPPPSKPPLLRFGGRVRRSGAPATIKQQTFVSLVPWGATTPERRAECQHSRDCNIHTFL